MEALLYASLTNQTLSETLGGPEFDWPTLTEGDSVRLALRFANRIDDTDVETYPDVQTVRLSVGKIDSRPTGGQWSLKLGTGNAGGGTNTTGALSWNATAAQIQTALETLLASPTFAITGQASLPNAVSVTAKDGSFLVVFNNTSVGAWANDIPLSAGLNTLDPVSFVRHRSWLSNTQRIHEIRLTQSPLAFADSWDFVVPAAPGVSVVREGGESAGVSYNEIQHLEVPPAFRGSYYLQRTDTSRKSELLSTADGPEEIALALANLADDGGQFVVTNPLSNAAHIEFAGSMGGIDQDLLEVHVATAPPGDTTIEMSLATASVYQLFRTASLVEGLALELEVTYEGPDEEIRTWSYRATVSMQRELISAGLAAAQNIDWLRPPGPRDYVPFNLNQVITGSQHYATTLGNGVDSVITVDHNLDTEAIHLTIRENVPGGEILRLGTDYTVVVDDENSVTITFIAGYPESAEYAAVITSAGPTSAFQAHTHTIGQITDLQSILDGLGERLSDLEELAPAGVLSSPEATSVSSSWTLPRAFEVYPTREPVTADSIQALIDGDVALPKAGGLLAAIHDASTESLTVPLPAPASNLTGRVFANNSGSTVTLPGGLGRRGVPLKAGEFAACDGRVWYRVERFGSESSYYPSDFTRELFTLFVNERQFRLRTEFSLQFAVELAVLKSNTSCQWSLEIQTGTAPQDTSPGTTGSNLQNVVWTSTPVLAQRLILTPVACQHVFGLRIKRSLVGVTDTITLDQLLYGASIAGTAPASANFAVRARLVRFDTENSQSDPRGFVAVKGLGLTGEQAADFPDIGRAVVRA